jgi:MATE family multidrug resistance protein
MKKNEYNSLLNITEESYFTQFKNISSELSKIVFPQILFFYCIYSQGTVNLFFISHKYNDADMINAIGIANLYLNITTRIIISGIIDALETLASNAFGNKNYKLLGIYFDRCRVISFIFWIFIVIFHFFFAKIILKFLCVEERVIDMTLQYISIHIFSNLIDVNFQINTKHFILLEKTKINFYIAIGCMIIQFILCWFFVSICSLGVNGAALSIFFSSIYNNIISTYILFKMNLPEGSLIYFTKDSLKQWNNYLKIAIPGIVISGGEWLGYELQGIFAIYLSSLDYSVHIILINLEILCFPNSIGINAAISMKCGDKIISENPNYMKRYIFLSHIFALLCSLVILFLILFFGNQYFYYMSPTENIYIYCKKVKYILSWYIFIDNAYYFYLGCLKGIGYLKNPTIASFIIFYVVDTLLTLLFAFKLKFGVKGIWGSSSIGVTIGAFLFAYWVYSFDMNEMKSLALKRIKLDNIHLENQNIKKRFLEDKIKNNILQKDNIEMDFM